ncbi:MAG: L,D-transpeptidase [Longimicrobiales bacterium]
MRRIVFAAAPLVCAAGLLAFLATGRPAAVDDPSTLSIEVDLAARELHVYDEGSEVTTYRIAVGQPAHPTPQGTFEIRHIIWNPRWVPPDSEWAEGRTAAEPGDPDNPMGRVKIFFREPDYYIHGTNNLESLGNAESHGCLRMANDDVIALARLMMERGGEPRSPNWFKRVINRIRSTREVFLQRPVVLTVK